MNFRSKTLKTLICTLIIAAILIPYATPVFAVLTHEQNSAQLETSKFHEGGEDALDGIPTEYQYLYDYHTYRYKVKDTDVLKIVETGDVNFQNAIYCLDASKSFPGTTSLTYKNVGDFKDSTNINVASLGLSAEDYTSLVWLVDNMYLKKQTPEQKDEFIAKAFAEEIEATKDAVLPTTVDFVKAHLTDDDIEVVQQWAMWYFTNRAGNDKYGSFGPVTISKDGTNFGSYVDTVGSDMRQKYAATLYNYLIESATNYTEEAAVVYPSVDKTVTKTEQTIENDYYILGPIKVNGGNVSSEAYTIELLDGTGNVIDSNKYKLKIKGEEAFSNKNVSELVNQEYYIYVPIGTDLSTLNLQINYSKYTTKATMWSVADANYQPVVLITREKEPVTENLPIKIDKKEYDLVLRKTIVKVNDEAFDRNVQVHTSKLISGETTTAEYLHAKNPIEIAPGDKVVFEIRIFNEGSLPGTAAQVKDYLPAGMEMVSSEESSINRNYGWVISADKRVATTAYPAQYTLNAFDSESNEIDSISMQIECRVSNELASGTVLTNIAEIASDEIDDRDSAPGTMGESITNGTVNQETYTGDNSNKEDLSDSDYYYEGFEDDDDFEKVIIKGKIYDLALKKFVDTVNGKEPSVAREITVDTTPLKNGAKDATYTLSKVPVLVEQGDVVIYTIRVYNEGDTAAYAEEVADYIPEGLGLLLNHNINYDNRWAISEGSTSVKLSTINNGTKNLKLSDFTDVTSLDNVEVVVGEAKITSSALSYASTNNKNLIPAFDKEDPNAKLSYKDIQVACIVIADEDKENVNYKNIAEISKEKDENGNDIERDIDSVPDSIQDPDTYPEQGNVEDDDDYDELVTEYKKFDLSLQKFITALNDEAVTDRVPQISKLSDGTLAYRHTAKALEVANNDLVTYTIRVYNEGEVGGYAAEIGDNIPEGLVFVKDNVTNVAYGWKMYDKDGKETTDIKQAVEVRTDYLSKEKGEARGVDTLIKAYNPNAELSTDPENANPDFRDVKLVFRVDEKEVDSDRTIENIAEITDDRDEDNKPVEDEDSVPGNDDLDEDDIDTEKVIVKYFDLSLVKYVTRVIVTEDGKTTVTQTGHTGKEKPEPLVKVEVHRKKLNSTVVKFVYKIRVTNEGEIAGFATEIKDHIPQGLKFVQEDNKTWTKVDDRTIVTNELAKKLLQPGESAEVEVTLTWVNGENNLGTKINVAEISDDYNDNGAEDIDSVPNNKIETEDDIDEAPVILTIATGSEPMYISLITICLSIVGTGIFLIKKYVL